MHGDFSDLFSTIPVPDHAETARRDVREEKAIVETPISKERNQRKREARPRATRTSTREAQARSTSKYRGVTHHCRTGKFESHVWHRGKQVYLGGFSRYHSHSHCFPCFTVILTAKNKRDGVDIIAIKCRGERAQTNFDLRNYAGELANLDSITEEDLVLSLRRQSKGFSKGSSRFRGVRATPGQI